MRRNLLFWLGGSVIGALLGGSQPAAAQARSPVRTLSFGIVPQQSAGKLARAWIPVLGALSERAGLLLRFSTAPDIPAFERRLAAGAYDIAYMNPYHYSVFAQKPGYVAFAKEKERRLRGLVVVRKDSAIKDMKELAGQQIAFPAPASFGATLLVRAEFERLGVPIKPVFVKSHESVYLNVAQRQVEAGGGIVHTLQDTEASVRDALRVLWQTTDYTPHAFAAHPRVQAADLQALRAAMLTADSDPRMRSALEAIGFKGFDAAQDAEWNDVRALGIRTLAALLKE
ncbi:phosphate/phosphite/phosphonate ABC transporter substrate-binding protein [Sphaerotilus sp.]|uniref:phosphate/phosphite/phosphonate ABC transporter substrate-binding protein n=1 Tax=Sphaerotilus sp. TaxID=2093942 RepID=UPI0034E278EB